MIRRHAIAALAVLAFALSAPAARGARIKDLADVGGVRGNPLVGYGLVIGLNGSGDSASNKATEDSLINLLENLGLTIQPGELKSGNVAGVLVTGELPAFARQGSRIDVLISSIGNAKSLQGGTLLLTPLRGADGHVYAVAQGPLSIGGFSVAQGGDQVQKNHPTVGKMVDGATVEREVPYDLNRLSDLTITLHNPDFLTVTRMAEAINQALGTSCSKAVDGSTVRIQVPEKYKGNMVEMVALVEGVDVVPDRFAKVVVNERTGTIIMGDQVRIGRVAIAHGSLNIQINEKSDVSQPLPFSRGETKSNKNSQIDVFEENGQMHILGGGVSIGDLVGALNAIGATPRDLIAILQAIKEAGALQARLEIL